jgi:PAS domain S-box-containing protein
MDNNPESPVDEVVQLRRRLNELASIMALPSVWAGGGPRTICSTLADALLGTLELAFVFIRLNETGGTPMIEMIRTAEAIRPSFQIQDVEGVAAAAGGEAGPTGPLLTRVKVRGSEFSVLISLLGDEGEIGIVVAGSESRDFPDEPERLLLNVAASQAVLGLQRARLLNEQKPVTRDFDDRVAPRAREFAAADEQLQKQDRESRLIVDNFPGMVALLSPTGEVDMINRQVSDYFGQTLEQLKLWGTNDTIHPEDLPHVIEVFSRSITTGTPYEILQRFKRADGVYRWFQNRSFPVRDTRGNIDRWCVLLTDIDSQKRAEEALRERELNLRQITETIPEMLWSATPEGSVDYCNGRLLEFTGFTPAEVQGSNWIRLIHPDDVDRAAENWRHCVKTGEPYQVEVRTLHASDRTYRWCITRGLPLVDSEGRIVKWHGTVVDMHDWKVAQEELRSTQAELARAMRVMAMGELTASIAHEVNQPLAAIITNANICLRMLSTTPANIDGARESALRTLRDGNRASDVITRVRSLFDRKQIANEPIDLNEVAREVIALQLDELQKSRVTVRHEFEENLPMMKGDRLQIQQVILNLVRNASEAMKDLTDRAKLMIVRTECGDADDVRLVVKDVGSGFEPGATDRLFEPFYTTKIDGMGIGLSLSRSIVEAHQGRMWAEANDGPGATFAFSIPVATEADSVAGAPATNS